MIDHVSGYKDHITLVVAIYHYHIVFVLIDNINDYGNLCTGLLYVHTLLHECTPSPFDHNCGPLSEQLPLHCVVLFYEITLLHFGASIYSRPIIIAGYKNFGDLLGPIVEVTVVPECRLELTHSLIELSAHKAHRLKQGQLLSMGLLE